jgi:hypothetical protein
MPQAELEGEACPAVPPQRNSIPPVPRAGSNQCLDDAWLGQHVVVIVHEQRVHDQPDHLARCEVLARGLVREFREPADQLLRRPEAY